MNAHFSKVDGRVWNRGMCIRVPEVVGGHGGNVRVPASHEGRHVEL
jgi:hypothetical protein